MQKFKKILSVVFVVVFCVQMIAPGITAISATPLIGNNAAMTATKGVMLDGSEESTPLASTNLNVNNSSIPNDTTPQNTSIIGEIKEWRTESTKHFRHKDGTYTAAIYSEPVHYVDSTGDWKDIDNTLVLNEKKTSVSKKATYTPTSSALDIRVPQDFTSNQKLTIGKNGYTIGMSVKLPLNISTSQMVDLSASQRIASSKAEIINQYEELTVTNDLNSKLEDENKTLTVAEENTAKMKLSNKVSAVNYNNIFENADLQYIITPSKIKENIIVKSAQDSYIYEFDLSLDGLIPVQQENGSIYLYENSEDSNALFIIEAPYMYDANEETSFDVSMVLNGNTLTVIADPEWINDASREFPVTIDPTISTGSSVFYDATVDYTTPLFNYESYKFLYAGNGVLSLRRAYIKFDLPTIPDGSVVTKSELKLHQYDIEVGNDDLYLYVVDLTEQSPWSENSITWNNQPLPKSKNGPQDDYTIKKLDYDTFVVNGDTQEYVLNLTKAVKNWYEGDVNNGIMISSSNENKNSQTTLYSSEHTSATYHPSVTIEYSNNIGLEDYWTYETREMGRSGTVYANPHNGSVTYLHNDLSMTGNLLPIKISHVYNSNTDRIYTSHYDGMSVGEKYHLNIQELLIRINSTEDLYYEGYRYKYYDGDGTLHYFKDTLVSPNVVRHALEYDPTTYVAITDSYRMIKYPDGSKKYFYNDGRLYKIVDNNGNTQTFTFEGNKITQITDPVGRVVELSYNPNGQLVSITDPSGRVVSYTYGDSSSANRLTSITYPDGKQTQISYTTNDYLLSLTAVDNSSLQFDYNDVPTRGRRVSWIYPYDKSGTRIDKVKFSYKNTNESGSASGNIVVSNNYGDSKTYLFDKYGRAMSITNQHGQSQYAVYGSDATNKSDEFNKILSSSDMLTSSINLLKNHDFERNDYWTCLQTATSGSCDYHTEESSNGYRSLIMELTESNGIYEVAQDIQATEGRSYTVSLDVYIPKKLIASGDNGVSFGFVYCLDGVWYSESSNAITSTIGWERFAHTITIPQGNLSNCHVFMKLANANGVVYFDSIQAEESAGARYYNLVENADFSNTPDVAEGEPAAGSGAYAWSMAGIQSGDGVYTVEGRNYMFMSGSPDYNKRLAQTIPVKASAGDTLIIGGRAGAYATDGSDDGRWFRAYAELYNGNLCFDAVTIDFDRSVNQAHQTRAAVKTLTQDCDSIIYYFVYFYHLDSVSFDDAFIYLDKYGNHYNYESGLLESEYNDEGKTTTYTYSNNNVTEIKETVSGVEQTAATYTYDSNHNVTSATNNIGTTMDYAYNTAGQITTQSTVFTDSENQTVKMAEHFTYYQNGNYVKTYTDENGKTTKYIYDNDNSENGDNIVKGLLTSVIDSTGNVTTYTYDPDTDELLSASGSDYNSGVSSTSFTYENYMPKTISKNGTTYSYDYDSQNRVVASKVGTQTLATNSYDSEQRLSQVTYANNAVYNPVYDGQDRLAGDSWNGNRISEYYYNNNDRLSMIVDNVTNTSYQYDYAFYDLPFRVTGSDGTLTTYDYDRSGSLARLTFSDNGDTIYSGRYYTNEKGQPEDVIIDSLDSTLIHYNYDEMGRLTSYSCGPIIREISYNLFLDSENEASTSNQICMVVDTDREGRYLQYYHLEYYDDGRLCISVEEPEQQTYFYVYDGLGRVVEDFITEDMYTYSYDSAGNIISSEKNGDARHTFTYGNSNWKDQLTAVDGKAITYDANGNPLTYDGYNFAWQRGTLLSGVSGNGKNISYVYDSQGRRVQKTVNGVTTEFLYCGDLLMRQTDGTNTIDFQYDANGDAICFIYNGVPYYYMRNVLNDIVGLVTEDGDIVARYRYDSYGNIIYSEGELAAVNPIRYRGYYCDSETGWYYLESRYYNPDWYRFISPDCLFIAGDVITGNNMYAYCNGDPISNVDPNGNASEENDFVKITRPLVNIVTILGWIAPEAVANKLINKDFGGGTNDFSYFSESNPLFEEVMPFFTNELLYYADYIIAPLTGKADWKDRVYETDKGLQYILWPYTMSMGARLGAFFLEFFPDDSMTPNYSTQEGQYQWQHNMGYNWYYDAFFSLGGPIKKLVYDFDSTNNEGETKYYAVWCWKGDYWNLGPGAEIGIYVQEDEQRAKRGFYDIDKDNLKVKTHMKVKHKDYYAEIKQTNWWITMFMPWKGQRINLEDLTVWQAVSFDIPVGEKDDNGTPYILDYSIHDNLNLFDSFVNSKWTRKINEGDELNLKWGPSPPANAGWDYLNFDGSYYGNFQFYIKF